MPSLGHIHGLKEIKGLVHFLEQAARQSQCVLRLLQLDMTLICEAIPADKPPDLDHLAEDQYEKIVADWLKGGKRDQSQEVTCFGEKKLLIRPIDSQGHVEGFLTAYPLTAEIRPFLDSIAEFISGCVELTHSAVHEWERRLSSLKANNQLHDQTEELTSPDEVYPIVLNVLLDHINAEVGIFVPRHTDGIQWEMPVVQNKAAQSEDWLAHLSSKVTTMYDQRRCPMIVEPENLTDHTELLELGVSSFISATVFHGEKVLGLLIFCSQDTTHALSHGDRLLLESLTGLIGLRLHNLHNQRLIHELRETEMKQQLLEAAIDTFQLPIDSITELVEKLVANDEAVSPDERADCLSLLDDEVKRLKRVFVVRFLRQNSHDSVF